MSQPPPYYSQQPTSNPGYYPQQGQPYPQQGQYPAGGYYNQPQPQVIYVDRPQPQRESNNDWWLTSLLALCCGCCLGEMLCDQPCLCCVLPCPLRFPRFR